MPDFRRFSGSKALRAGGMLVGGAVLAQLITLASTPLLARMYEPEAFGYLSIVSAVASVVASVAGLRLESALLLPETQRDASAIFATSTLAILAVSCFSSLALEVVLRQGFLASWASLPYFPLWVGVLSFTTAFLLLLTQFALRSLRYKTVAKRGVHQALATNSVQIGAWFVHPGAGGLLFGHALGRMMAGMPLFLSVRRDFRNFTVRDMRRVLREYWRFPLHFTLSSLLNSLGLVLPLIFVGAWFGIRDGGVWGMADRLIALPALLVGGAAAQVVESQLAHLRRQSGGSARSYYLKASALLGCLGVVVSVAVLVLADPIVRVLLGSSWDEVPELLRAMSLMAGARIVAVPLSKSLVVFEKSGANLLLDLSRVVIVGVAIFAAAAAGMTLGEAALVTSSAMAVVYVVTWIVGYIAVRDDPAANEKVEGD